VRLRELEISDAFEITPQEFSDDRGSFFEWYRFDRLSEQVGHPLELRQANASISRRGVLRGVHFADVPRGQAKYVTVTRGAALDIVVDIRVGSPTFGRWDSVLLDTVDRKAAYLAEGLGHAVLALEDDTTLTYLVSDTFSPNTEHGIDPLDPALGIVYPIPVEELILSDKDRAATSLAEAEASGLLPSWAEVQAFYASLGSKARA
jgi:dTDP-4-dehydrorhamnose 3,5-epimerase